MELLKRHAFALKEYTNLPNDDKIMNSLDAIIHFSRIFGVRSNKAGALLVQFVFSIIWQLVDTLLDDDGLLHLTPEKNSIWHTKPQEMEIDSPNNFDEKRIEHTERLLNLNTIMSVELIGQFLQNKVTSRILYLARQNMSELQSFLYVVFKVCVFVLFLS
ncbi:mediator of RNA polymerase II transcription subunit 33B-like [Olea europaea var. sylvestris]|uniref:mediator of RNA polymerase II transcription subunit 33B-like n=1 Tax=Olea europaea var. sylvestris TaxID=158386 RepID=UPI000C1CD5F9|nr:mediator of RNA polymerase II transcription subunit 33B-like [Olea europaea var. sylvestris]